MNKELVIVFVKNIKPGHVKTRLAKTVGNDDAVSVYKALLNITENVTNQLDCDVAIHFSEAVENSIWKNTPKTIQQGQDLGERMKNAFHKGFNDGYKRVVLIGSDLPNLTKTHINTAFEKLKENDIVFGPAKDGGYYLVGQSKPHCFIFENKPWSETNLLEVTLNEITHKKIPFSTLETLNDIDTFEDLEPFPELLKIVSYSKNDVKL